MARVGYYQDPEAPEANSLVVGSSAATVDDVRFFAFDELDGSAMHPSIRKRIDDYLAGGEPRAAQRIFLSTGGRSRVRGFVYVDNDPMVDRHTEALLAGTTGVTAVHEDVRNPARIPGRATGYRTCPGRPRWSSPRSCISPPARTSRRRSPALHRCPGSRAATWCSSTPLCWPPTRTQRNRVSAANADEEAPARGRQGPLRLRPPPIPVSPGRPVPVPPGDRLHRDAPGYAHRAHHQHRLPRPRGTRQGVTPARAWPARTGSTVSSAVLVEEHALKVWGT
jgi:S-adenosyl methyltransferase